MNDKADLHKKLAAARRAYEYPHDCGDDDPFSRNTYDTVEHILDILEILIGEEVLD
jgi:hypothetical protein